MSVGINHDTAAFAVRHSPVVACHGRDRYPEATLLVSRPRRRLQGYRDRLWKWELHGWPTRPGFRFRCITSPGTSKWNKIEHRLFSFISQNWRAKPLVSYQVIVNLISATTTSTGLEVRCELDANTYPKGVTVPDAEMASLNIECAEFHGEWNYTIRPTNRSF